MPMSPKDDSGAPWSGSGGGGEFGEELKRAHEHQNTKMAAESAAAAGLSAATNSGTSANTVDSAEQAPPADPSGVGDVEAATPDDERATADAAGGGGGEEGGEMGALAPGKMRLRALYDYEATQEGDLSFQSGDMIITDMGAFSEDGWVSGDCHGKSGIFPSNYTELW